MYKAPNLPSNNHAFFGRLGGVSKGDHASLNTNALSNDNPEDIRKNLEIIARLFKKPASRLNILNQTKHTNQAVYIEEAANKKIIADGSVTKSKDILLGVTTADCVPVLFLDCKHEIIGASHAGWRGALSGVLESTLDLMLEHGAEKKHIRAAIGPCLQQKSFEAKDDLYEQFKAPEFFQKLEEGRYLFDLEGYVEKRLKEYGLTDISKSGIDTYSNPDEYYSYRRSTHKKIKAMPTQIAVIGL